MGLSKCTKVIQQAKARKEDILLGNSNIIKMRILFFFNFMYYNAVS